MSDKVTSNSTGSLRQAQGAAPADTPEKPLNPYTLTRNKAQGASNKLRVTRNQ